MTPRLAAALLAAAALLPAAGCTSTGDLLSVTDPDIVNPSDVQSAAGANAVRLGAIARLNAATSGGSTVSEGLFLLSGLFADEWENGDSFIARQEVDQRVITIQNNFLTDVSRLLHRSRLSAEQATRLLREFSPNAPAAEVAEMYFVQAYVENAVAEHYCNGLVFSTVTEAGEQFGAPITTTAAYERALAHADSGLALVTGSTALDVRTRSALRVIRGRILLNLNRPADAATAVNGVATNFRYEMLHSATTNANAIWSYNNLNRRYSVGNSEGTNGLNFATAADPRLPTCQGGDAACRAAGVTQTRRDDSGPLRFDVQLLWPARETPVPIATGIEARMIEAEAQLRANNPTASLATLNAARTTVTGLAPLADAGTEAARVTQLFRERAFWMFGTGHRVGDLRRLVRQYNRPANTVFPTGAWNKGGAYGGDVNFPVPQAEENNPNVPQGNTCIDRNA
ncbi:hypothetical protein [Roseisolibacter sp. H3M3-2]|uniref:hypothetical protein n=1 Tax=Roseisolibacter sp. H3M3-2 TaxID=3031323 RepID=UPI0023DBEA5B|nr:hypothetical protein [Roseisolibacter sp. H3M3-2]MDF1504311.1 hypothetical protein [Roseisolibacter sp. H3M3-2]